MREGARAKKPATEQGYRLADLSNLSGVSREMLKYYFRAGLLPRERSQRRKWSSYSDVYIQLIRLIQQFQRQTRLTLPQIAKVFQDASHDPKVIQVGLLSGQYEKASEPRSVTGIAPPVAESDEPELELPREFVTQLREHGLAPRHRDLSRPEERAAVLVHAGMNAGMHVEFFMEAHKLLDQLAELQVRAMMSVDLTATPDTVSRNVKIIETNRVINRWIVHDKDLLIQGRLFRVYEKSKKAVDRLAKWMYVPSEAFIRKHGVDRELAELETQCAVPGNRARLLPGLAETYLVLGRNEQAAEAAFEALEAGSDNLSKLAVAVRTEEFRGNFDRSALLIARIMELYPENPAALAAVGADYLIQAARSRATGGTDEWFVKAVNVYNRLSVMKPASRRELFDQRYFRGNANAIFPDALGQNKEVVSELVAAIAQVDEGEDLAFPIPSMGMIHKVAILYFMGAIREHTGDSKGADEARREVVQMDPASNFGLAAFEKIGLSPKNK